MLAWVNGGPLRRPIARWILRLDTEETIAEIGPHFYRVDLPTGQCRATFRTHAKYSKRLYHALWPVWWLLHFVDWLALDRWAPQWAFGFYTLPTVYPQAGSGGGNTTCDGFIRNYAYPGGTWATMRGATDGTSTGLASANTYCIDVSAGDAINRYEYIQRGGFSFSTSAIGAGATVTAATLGLRGTSKDSTYSSIDNSADVVSFNPANAASFSTADFDQFGTTSYANVAYASLSTSAYTNFALNASGLADISVTGVTKLGVRMGCDRSNTEPTEAAYDTAYWIIYYADQTGTTTDPKLDVTYTPASTKTYKQPLTGAGIMGV